MNYRNRKLLDLAHEIHECANCGRYVPDGCEPAHENGIEAGKGFGIKANDNRFAALCHEDHAWYDQGRGTSPCGCYDGIAADKAAMWNRAHKKTFDLLWQLGLIKVA